MSPEGENPLQPVKTLQVDSSKTRTAGDFVWGSGFTRAYLFASSEGHGGRHKAFNIETGKSIYRLEVSETGDALSLNPEGTSPRGGTILFN